MKKTYISLLLVFVSPVILSVGLYFYMTNFSQNANTSNYGKLVEPITKYESLSSIIPNDPEKPQWSFISIYDECKQQCLANIELIKKVKILLEKESNRVRVLSMTKKNIMPTPTFDLTTIRYDVELVSKLFKSTKQVGAMDSNGLYLFDPLNNLVLYYEGEEINGKEVLSDIKRLLKYSRIG